MQSIVTLPPRVEESAGRRRITAHVVDAEPLWFDVDAAYGGLLTDRADHIAVALLMPAMREGQDLHVGGVVTDVLLHQLNGDVQVLLRALHPGHHRVRVMADRTAPAGPAASGVATGFSGGVDSFAALDEYAFAQDIPAALRITHLLNNNVGAHGRDGTALWHRRCDRLRVVAEGYGLPFVMVDSNLDAHYPLIGFSNSVTMRNAAVAFALSGGIGRLHYASSDSYRDVRMPTTGNISLLDSILLPLLSTPALTLASAGSATTRVEKTLALVGRPEARHLDVCTSDETGDAINCSRCFKCMRTMLTLEIAGHLEEFAPQPFQLAPYRERRSEFLGELLSSESPLAYEVIEFAAQRKWRFSPAARARGLGRRTRHAAWTRARALKHRLRPRPAP